MLQEAGVDAGVAHRDRHPVEQALAVHDRAYHVLGGVDQLEGVDAVADAEVVAHRGERLVRRVAGTGAEAAGGPVDLHRAGPHGEHAVADGEAEVVVTVEAHLGVGTELGHHRGDALGGLVEDQRAGRVDDVDALAAGVGHDARLAGQVVGRRHVGHHQEPHGLQADLAGEAEVLDRDVGLGAVRGDAHDRHADVLDRPDVVHRAEPREHERGDIGPARFVDGGLHQHALVDQAEAVVETGTT